MITANLPVKVVPRAAKSEIVGWLNGALKIRVAAVPQDGRANDALETLLADALGVRRTAVRVASGHGSSRKLVAIEGLDRAEIDRRLGQL